MVSDQVAIMVGTGEYWDHNLVIVDSDPSRVTRLQFHDTRSLLVIGSLFNWVAKRKLDYALVGLLNSPFLQFKFR